MAWKKVMTTTKSPAFHDSITARKDTKEKARLASMEKLFPHANKLAKYKITRLTLAIDLFSPVAPYKN